MTGASLRIPRDSQSIVRLGPVTLVLVCGMLVGTLFWQTTGLAAVSLIAFWCGMQRPDLGLGLLALSIPLQAHLEVGIQSSSITLTKVVIWGLLIGWSVALLSKRQRVLVDFVSVAIFAVVAALVVSVWNARDVSLWVGESYRWVATAIVATFAFNAFRRGASPLPFLLCSLAGVTGSILLALWQVVNVVGPESFNVRGILRAYGPFTHPNQLAIYLELIGPLFLALFAGSSGSLRRDHQWYLGPTWRPAWLLGFLMSGFGLVLSQSRGGAIGMVVGVGIVLVLQRPSIRLTTIRIAPVALIAAIGFMTIAIGIVAAGVQTFAQQDVLVTPSNFAVQERLSHWTAAVEMAKAHPFTGVGAGNYDLNYREYTQDWRFRIGRGHAHDTYLHFLAQSGVVGLTAYIALLLGVSLIIVRTIRILPDGTRLSLLIGAAGITAAISIHAIFEYVHVLSLNLQLAVVWAMAIAIGTEAWNDREHCA